ncbi:hypothetical protein BCF11_3416 [Collimonas sp. PA-H2]|nr:hypothetical protein BCF11_3416 [Collimonas sp. PA-H2]
MFYHNIVAPSLAATHHNIMKILPRAVRIPQGRTAQPRNVRLMPTELVEVKHYAANEDESIAWFLHYLIFRGLADYKRELASYQ